ncbi:zinc ribbon domain-containing protein [Lacrimispora sp. 210928-DFI.3.58]|uniref:zinc ribbon domain-containing protein n=1 Tax=Lacrimispora sp. 210928-DFI.3.58 TaxID=2883214 RepID=UPI001D05C723|nr:zinc ribbon domain-containing protein [Lacrimispora sp. 210928-DFI.3.58]MCB7319120.1 zinc ribbon domain-containing protein [Lacrimispora sp. 210928-DFI.3.58]
MSSYLFAGILLLVLAGGFFIYWKVKRTARRVSKALFGTEDWEEGMRKRRLEESLTPRSVSGMTSVYLPQIKKDFPEFDWPEFRARSQNLLASFLKAVSSQELSLLNGASSEILDQARLWISDLKSQEIEELFQDIKIHRTEILGYTKEKGTCTITIQTSVQYLHYKRRNGQILSGSKEYLEQSRYNMELQYVQDENKAAGEGAAVGLTCPQCGAPVTRLGEAFCEYCGTAVTRVNIRSWQFIKIRS